MKKIITAVCAAALLALLTACNNETASDSGISSSIPESTDQSTPESSDSAPESTALDIETGVSVPEELIDGFSLDEIPLPDGTKLKKTEAVDGIGSADYPILKFNVAVMRYCKPVFQSNLDDPDSFDWDNYTFFEPVEEPEEDRVVTVRAGDVLENGMTVKSTYTYFEVQFGKPYYNLSEIELEGEQTVEGIIYLREEDDYAAFKDHLELYIDTSKCENLPMRYQQYGATASTYSFPEHKVAVTIDGCYYDLGNINEINVDFSEIFLDSPFTKVKVTIKNPVLRISESTTLKAAAELVDIEIL